MHHFLWGKMVLVLVAVVAILQVIHLVLLSRLEASHHHHQHAEDRRGVVSGGNEAEAAFASLVRSLHESRVLDSSGEYQLVPHLAPGTRLPQPKSTSTVPDIALVTQCSLNHLHNLIPLIQRWQGPVSIAVFAEDQEISDALWRIAGLRICYSMILHNVSFQLVSPLPADNHPPLSVPADPSPPCDLPTPKATQTSNYASSKRYPNNLLRNAARRGTSAEFVLVIDIDMLPNANLHEDFYNFAVKNRLFSETHQEDKTVYVIPSFEARDSVAPQNKYELLQLLDAGDVRPFYYELCWKCQVHTDYETWGKELPSKGVAPLFEVLWKDPWEPFYIARNSVPFYDERFKQYGFNRISQVCELHVAGYKFSVLNNGFLLHKGFKTTASFHANKDIDQERNRMLFRQFKTELRDKYPESSRRCY